MRYLSWEILHSILRNAYQMLSLLFIYFLFLFSSQILDSILRNAYQMLSLFHGSIQDMMASVGAVIFF
jgi:hypothetical protein